MVADVQFKNSLAPKDLNQGLRNVLWDIVKFIDAMEEKCKFSYDRLIYPNV